MRQQPRFALICLALLSLNGCAFHIPEQLKSPWAGSPAPSKNGAPSERPTELPPQKKAIACITTAETLETQGHAREAALLYERARAADANAINYARRLAVLHDRLGNAARAEEEFREALRVAPRDPDLRNDYGDFQMRSGRLAAAEATFREVLADAPTHPQANINLGKTLARQARWQESFEIFALAVGDAAAHSNVGVLMAKAGHYAEAEAAFEQALAMDPNLPQARAFLDKLRAVR